MASARKGGAGIRRSTGTKAKSARNARSTSRRKISPSLLGGIFPAVAGKRAGIAGVGAFIGVAEALGEHVDAEIVRLDDFAIGQQAKRQPNAAIERAARHVSRGDMEALTQVLAAMGSLHRFRMLTGLLEGPLTYRALQRRTGLKAGPLYHHVNQLRLARIIGPKSRDTYALTRSGRNAVLVALSLRPLLGDGRARPTPGAR